MEKKFFLMMNMFFVIVCSSCHFFHAAWWGGGGSAKMLDWFFRLSLEYYVDRFQQSIILDGKSITWIYSFIFVQWQLIALFIYIDTYRMENQFDYCRHQHNIKSFLFNVFVYWFLLHINRGQCSNRKVYKAANAILYLKYVTYIFCHNVCSFWSKPFESQT